MDTEHEDFTVEVPDDVLLRPAQPGDRPFVMDTWLRSHRRHVEAPTQMYYSHWRPMLTRLLDDPRVEVRCACSVTSPAWLTSWICVAPQRDSEVNATVHYAYTLSVLRGFGLMRMLLESFGIKRDTPIDYTCDSRVARRLAAKQTTPAAFLRLENWLVG